MPYLAIMNWDVNNRAWKGQSFSTLGEAQALAKQGGQLPGTRADAFAVLSSGGNINDQIVDSVAKTVTLSPAPATKEQVNALILAKIVVKERLADRPIRELRRMQEWADVPLGDVTAAKNRLKALDDDIRALREQLLP